MKYLNVAEKNDAAKTIANQLSHGTSSRREGLSVYNKIYEFEASVFGTKSQMVMTSVSGHLLTFEFLSGYRNWNNIDPQSLFDAPVRKSCSENFVAIKRTLEREVRLCQGLIIWTDCDREGENIGFEIIDVCRAVKPSIKVYRAIFSEITGVAVKRALQNLAQPDKKQSDAVDVRSELDLRTGAAITRFQTMRLQKLFPEKISDKLISYGSCQIPTLGFVAERYKEIESFVSEPFWKIKVTHTIDDLTVEFLWERNRLFDKKSCEDYYAIIMANPIAKVESVTVKPKSKWRPTPLDTVELEKLGSRKLKLTAKEVMSIAEKLYSKGIISYPRTETNIFSKEINLKDLVQQQTVHGNWGSFAQRVADWGPNPRNGNKSDQAHPPIHPTKMVTNLDGNEGRVYELICRHFLACVSKDAVGSETIVTITIEGEKFKANGLIIYERNYLDVYIYDKWNAKQIHKYENSQRFEPTEITMAEGRTTAPPLLTEADLIALMEKHGIGTDATHAEHINTIKERGYIGVVDKGFLVPGVIGMGLYEGYDAMELALAKPMLRAEFEQDLKKICLGEKDPKTILREQIVKYKVAYKQIVDKITAMDEKMAQRILETPVLTGISNTNLQTASAENHNRWQELFQCPKCSAASLALKAKKNQAGYLIGCLNFPDCKNCIWWPEECKDPTVLAETCSKCGSDIKLLKFKFLQPYHKLMFNSPTGWYKTCLQCDIQFRNTFNINLESVKRTGAIISDISSLPIKNGKLPSSKDCGNAEKKPKNEAKKMKQNAISKDVRTKVVKLNNSKQTINSNIRSYFTAGAQQTAEEIAAFELQNVPIDVFFDSNDGFEDFVSAGTSNIKNDANTPYNIQQETVLSDDLAVAFDEEDNDIFENFQWGSDSKKVIKKNFETLDNSASSTRVTNIEENFSDGNEDYVWGSAAKNERLSEISPSVKRYRLQNSEIENQKIPWGSTNEIMKLSSTFEIKCTGCHQLAKELCVKKEGPNKGRRFFACSKSNPCKFFQWSDEVDQQKEQPSMQSTTEFSNTTVKPDNEAHVNCNCNKPASNLTVRKEGPNKGRDFYTCANRDKSCGFFQWGNETESRKSNANADLRDNSLGASSSNFGSNSRAKSSTISSDASSWVLPDFDTAGDEEIINCNCNKTANSLIVRKDGPNKGRGFYACLNRNKPCGFFQWANETNNEEQRQLFHGSGSSDSSNNKKYSTIIKSRKCGLCRREGHTRQKCPRKSEFEY